ncbi:MAG: hypothetical protein ACKVS8_13425 [Phycisphaerales bacterium]
MSITKTPSTSTPPAPIIVLKLGGSVLRSTDDLARAAVEIYQHVRRGRKVIAVVSALYGETDRLLDLAAGWENAQNAEATALLASTGELSVAAQLALAVARSGLAVHVATPATIGLRAAGPPHDAEPAGVNVEAIRAILTRESVLVVPGFIAQNEAGSTVLLGRGGSDLTAIFLAATLTRAGERAICRLIKDVPGLFNKDPNVHDDARRLATVSWEEALAIGGDVLQPKAVRFALRSRTVIEVGALLDARRTLVGPYDRTFDEEEFVVRKRTLSVLGCGTVGGGVLRLLRLFPERFEVVAVACRNPERALAKGGGAEGVPRERVFTDALAAAGQGEIVVEALGGLEPAHACIAGALERGARGATANKAVIAHDATLADRGVATSACVGGGAPVLERCTRAAAHGISRLEGVLNGTCNFVLNRVGTGESLASALSAAREAGLCEVKACRDLEGLDAADKLRILSRAAFGEDLPLGAIELEAITGESIARARAAVPAGTENHWVLRQVATLARAEGGAGLAGSVRIVALPRTHALADLPGAWNRLLIHTPAGTQVVDGVGAGRWPTAHAVLADVLDLAAKRPENLTTKTQTSQRKARPKCHAHSGGSSGGAGG